MTDDRSLPPKRGEGGRVGGDGPVPIRVSELRLGVDEPEAVLPDRIARVLGVSADALGRWRILRKSLDARDKDRLQFVYAAEVALPEGESDVVARARRRSHPASRVEMYQEPPFVMPPPGERPLEHRPVVVGSGPGGLAAAYF